jgi:anti-sigma factor RsiW
MKCPIETRESAEVLLAYCARKLDAESTAAIERHIGICPACREFSRAQRAVWEALDAWEAAPVSADFDRRLYRRAGQEVSWWDLVTRPFRPMLVRPGVPIAAAACLVMIAGVVLQRPASLPPPAAPESAQVEAVQPDQVETALEDMQTLREFNRLVRPDSADSKM